MLAIGCNLNFHTGALVGPYDCIHYIGKIAVELEKDNSRTQGSEEYYLSYPCLPGGDQHTQHLLDNSDLNLGFPQVDVGIEIINLLGSSQVLWWMCLRSTGLDWIATGRRKEEMKHEG